jgi:PRTRC genetic system protein E
MLLQLQDLINKGKFAGVAVNVHPIGDGELSVIVTAQLPPINEKAHLITDSATQEARDAYFSVREALSTPLVFKGAADELDADIAQFVDSITENMERASEAMSTSAVAAKLDAAASQASTTKKKAEKKASAATAASKPTSKAADANSDKPSDKPKDKADSASTEDKAPAKPQDTFADFGDIDTI